MYRFIRENDEILLYITHNTYSYIGYIKFLKVIVITKIKINNKPHICMYKKDVR